MGVSRLLHHPDVLKSQPFLMLVIWCQTVFGYKTYLKWSERLEYLEREQWPVIIKHDPKCLNGSSNLVVVPKNFSAGGFYRIATGRLGKF